MIARPVGAVAPGYNRVVRHAALLILIAGLAACHGANQSNEAVRQGVLDYLSQKVQLNLSAMDVKLDSVSFDGNKAKAAVSISLKGSTTSMMSKQYELEQKDGKWVVTGRSGDAGHGATMPEGVMPGASPGPVAPGVENPHGGKMPSPEDLPPAGKTK
jgi:hypothetical protein